MFAPAARNVAKREREREWGGGGERERERRRERQRHRERFARFDELGNKVREKGVCVCVSHTHTLKDVDHALEQGRQGEREREREALSLPT
jgi:hypothetical protein